MPDSRSINDGQVAIKDGVLNISISQFENEYKTTAVLAERFSAELTRQVQQLLDASSISLSFPIQQRVKTWASLIEKLKRKELDLKSVTELDDLIGLRLILQFKRDVPKIVGLICQNFKVLKQYDTSDRLGTDQFGYSSIHLVVELLDSWLAVPTFSEMKGSRAEIQIRTTAQHIWAAASHILQYKQEDSVAYTMRRGIHRVSALLEMVDLEFERLLEQRDKYRGEAGQLAPDTILNVDLLENVLDTLLPEINKHSEEELYGAILDELRDFGIMDRKSLTELISEHLEAALAKDKERVQDLQIHPEEISSWSSPDRHALGVFYSHVGLTRVCLQEKFGDAWKAYQVRRARREPKKRRPRIEPS